MVGQRFKLAEDESFLLRVPNVYW